MSKGLPCKGTREGFPNGIINGLINYYILLLFLSFKYAKSVKYCVAGAEWYAVTGGMQDYNYIFHGTMEITLEVSCCKHPHAAQLEQHWLDNRRVILIIAFYF